MIEKIVTNEMIIDSFSEKKSINTYTLVFTRKAVRLDWQHGIENKLLSQNASKHQYFAIQIKFSI